MAPFENPAFVDAVEEAGLIFIGPSAKAIRAMGLKDAAKALMECKAGVPVVPGYHGDNQDGAFLKSEADRITYPVLIKARAGGGGKGMRRVDSAADFAARWKVLRREAREPRSAMARCWSKNIWRNRAISKCRSLAIITAMPCICSSAIAHCNAATRKVIEEAPAPGMTEIGTRAPPWAKRR